MRTRPPILILHASGTNRDREAAQACDMAGGAAEIVHVNQLLSGERRLANYRMLVVPGGFSYGDDLGAGKVLAVLLRHRLAEDLDRFVTLGRPVLGICNGFQALVKAGLLPGHAESSQSFTLARNDSARFECRWVYLQPEPAGRCIFTRGLTEPIYCPVAHGEGKFMARDEAGLARLESEGLVALRYAGPADLPAAYPWNPNGSMAHIAGICSAGGTVFGLMPHPEDHVVPQQHPRFHRGERGGSGLALFANGVRYAAEL
jgi:phosphoribosylformylglycinamidine synthase